MFDAPPSEAKGSTVPEDIVLGAAIFGAAGKPVAGLALKLGIGVIGLAEANGSTLAVAALGGGTNELPPPKGSLALDCFLLSSRKSRSPPFDSSAPAPNGSAPPPPEVS